MVRCRLKLVKNKRVCIARVCRDDIAQLLRHGHHQIAFQRAEQVIKDESLVQLYDLLDLHCQFLIFSLPYIRKCRDCPNDINEAASTLIYSSSIFAQLPELMPLRKLFGDRYGQTFVRNALHLLPGNLVNLQIKENYFFAKKVPDGSKYRLLAEIGGHQWGQKETGDDELVSVDEVEEFVSHDQRLFVFRIFDNPRNGNDKIGGLEQHSCHITKMEGEETGNGDSQELSRASFKDGGISLMNVHPKLPDYDELAHKFKALKTNSIADI